MLRRWKTSLKWKLIGLIVAILVSVVVLIGFFSYYDTSRTIRRDVAHFSEQVLRQANLNLNRLYQEYEQGFLVLGTSHEFEQWLRIEPDDPYELITSYYSLERNYLRSFLARHPEIMSISLLSDNGNGFNYALTANLSKSYTLASEPWLGDVGQQETIYQRVGTSMAYLDRNNVPSPELLLSVAGRFGRMEAKGYIKMDISLDAAQTVLDQMELGKEGQGLIARPDGTILVHQDAERVGGVLEPDITQHLEANSGSYFRKSTNQLIVFDTIPYTGWKMVAIVSHDEVAASIVRVRNVTLAVASAGVLVAIGLVTLVASSITRRLSMLRTKMKQVQFGNFKGRIEAAGTDEVADLGHSFNRMLGELDSSIAQLTETKLMQQRAAFSAMQSQIHSHFLYNALESINSMAHLAGNEEIERMTVSLSRMLRYTSNYRDTLVKLEDEIAHVDYYLNITRIRYGEDVVYSIDMPEDCRQAPCLKVVLQPIAENAIKHGIEATGEPTRLHVSVRRDGSMLSVVFEDNGTGYDDQRLEQFRQRLLQSAITPEEYASLTNVGLLNVHYRMRTYYQRTDVGISIEQGGRLGGVTVTVRFPFAEN